MNRIVLVLSVLVCLADQSWRGNVNRCFILVINLLRVSCFPRVSVLKIKSYTKIALLLCAFLYLTPVFAQEAEVRLVCFDYPPYMTEENGFVQGMMVDVVTEAFVRMKKRISIKLVPPLRGYQLLLAGQVDGMFTMKKTPEREAATTFTREPLLVQDFVIIVPNDSRFEFNGDLKSLAEIPLGVVNEGSYGAVFDTAARRGDFRRLEKSPDFLTNFRKLVANRMGAVVSARSAGFAILKTLNANHKFRVSGPPIETTQSYLIFNKALENQWLADEFDKVLATMKKDGSIRKIEKRYTD